MKLTRKVLDKCILKALKTTSNTHQMQQKRERNMKSASSNEVKKLEIDRYGINELRP